MVPGSTFAAADPSKALVQIAFPAGSSLFRLTAEGSTTSATVFPDGSAAMATTSLPAGETQPDVFGDGGGGPSNAAPTCRSEPTVSWQVPVPEHAPVQPEKVEPGAGVAVRTTLALSSNWAEQAAPQSIPAGAEEIRPEPAPDGVTVTVCLPAGAGGSATNVTNTFASAASLTAHPPRPVQPPPQPANLQPGSGAGVSTTCVPSASSAEQARPQSIPAGLERTVPEPVFETTRKCCAAGGGGAGGEPLGDPPSVPECPPPHAASNAESPTTPIQTTIPLRIGIVSLPMQRRRCRDARPRSGIEPGRGGGGERGARFCSADLIRRILVREGGDACLRAAEDERVHVVGPLVRVHRLEVHGVADDVDSSETPFAPCMSRATRATSSALPQELRLSIEIISGAARPSSISRPRRCTAASPRVISVCMLASFT